MTQTAAEALASRVFELDSVPGPVESSCKDLLLDVAGLCVAARKSDYVLAL